MNDRRLTMSHFLATVAAHDIYTLEALLDEGFHPKVIYRKAEKAANKGYTEYGTVADRPWIRPEGLNWLAVNRGVA